MAVVEAALVVVVFGLLVYGTIMVLTRPRAEARPALAAGTWRVGHYERDGATRVVVQKVTSEGGQVLDEHLVAEVPVGAADYDEQFLEAMATARQRRTLFETEEG